MWGIIAVGAVLTLLRQVAGHGDYLLDLRAFYCGGNAVMHHIDPYVTSLAPCERALASVNVGFRAPLPPFALLAYAPLTLLPYKAVTYAYIVAAWIAIGLIALTLAKLTGLRSSAVALGISPLLGYYCISLGQPTPFIALFVTGAAYALSVDRTEIAACLATLTLAYPQFGFPIVVSMICCMPRARVTLAVSIAALGIVGLIALGPAAHVQYIAKALPDEQRQTMIDGTQYSVTWLLERCGVSGWLPSTVASVWYVVALALGISFVRQRVQTARLRPLIALFPAALVPISSSFVHLQHIALALPFAMFSLSLRPSIQWALGLGLALLLVPWRDCIIGTHVVHDVARSLGFFAVGIAFLISTITSARSRNERLIWLMPAVAMACYAFATVVISVALRGYAGADTVVPNSLATLSFKAVTLTGLVAVIAYTVTVLWPRSRSLQPA